jgi:hypothetical protein
VDELEKTIALMGISESVTLSGPILATVRAALVREQAARPVVDAAEKWAEFNGSTNELLAALDAYRAASGSVEADTPAEPETHHANRFGHPVYVGDDWAVEQWSSGEIKVSVSDHRDPPGGQTYYFEPDLAAAIGAAAREVAGTPAVEPAAALIGRAFRAAREAAFAQQENPKRNLVAAGFSDIASKAESLPEREAEWAAALAVLRRALAGAGAPTEPADDTTEETTP